jgi:hypothetical protein
MAEEWFGIVFFTGDALLDTRMAEFSAGRSLIQCFGAGSKVLSVTAEDGVHA